MNKKNYNFESNRIARTQIFPSKNWVKAKLRHFFIIWLTFGSLCLLFNITIVLKCYFNPILYSKFLTFFFAFIHRGLSHVPGEFITSATFWLRMEWLTPFVPSVLEASLIMLEEYPFSSEAPSSMLSVSSFCSIGLPIQICLICFSLLLDFGELLMLCGKLKSMVI